MVGIGEELGDFVKDSTDLKLSVISVKIMILLINKNRILPRWKMC